MIFLYMQKMLIKNSSMPQIWGLSHDFKYLFTTDMEVLVVRISLHKLDYGHYKINPFDTLLQGFWEKNTGI